MSHIDVVVLHHIPSRHLEGRIHLKPAVRRGHLLLMSRWHIHIGLHVWLLHLVGHAVVRASCLPSRGFLVILRISILTLSAVYSDRGWVLLGYSSLQDVDAALGVAFSCSGWILSLGGSPLDRVLISELAHFSRSFI